MKRIVDVLGAGVGLIFFSPILAIVAIAIRIDLGPPVLFRQRRPGLHAKPFVLLKFRTMLNDVNSLGTSLADSKRLTKFGSILRRTSIDELPALWNVLVGNMSLVGPRPLLMEYLPLYSIEQARRHEVRPGITGWAQVNGRNAISWEQKFGYDVWYIDHQTMWLDLIIFWKTIVKVFSAEGISQDGHVTMEKFRGTEK
jgi:sugar transferase EpsL